MTISFQSHVVQKCSDVAISSVVGKLPRDGQFKMGEDGRFEITYESERFGTPGHLEKNMKGSFEGTSIKLSKVVSGKLDVLNKSISFDSGCITVTKPTTLMNINISLLGVKSIDEEVIEASGKWGFITKTANVSRDMLLFATVEWKN